MCHQLLKHTLEPVLCSNEAIAMEAQTQNKTGPHLPQIEKAPRSNQDLEWPQRQKKLKTVSPSYVVMVFHIINEVINQ